MVNGGYAGGNHKAHPEDLWAVNSNWEMEEPFPSVL